MENVEEVKKKSKGKENPDSRRFKLGHADLIELSGERIFKQSKGILQNRNQPYRILTLDHDRRNHP